MATERRLEKLGVLLREELSKILEREIEFPDGTFVTVTRADITPNRKSATVFVSLLGSRPKEAMEILVKSRYNIQHLINRKVSMRPVPKIRFEIDQEEFRREQVEKSISDLKKKGEL